MLSELLFFVIAGSSSEIFFLKTFFCFSRCLVKYLEFQLDSYLEWKV